MKGAAMASFQTAAETPDRDDEEEHPDVDCGHCGAYLGSHPCDEYVDCGECGGATLSQWAPEPEGPSDEEIAQRREAWVAATAEADASEESDALRRELDALRQTHAGDLARERERAEAAERECARLAAIVDAARADAAVIGRALGPEWVSGETHADTVARLVAYARRATDMVDEIRGAAIESNVRVAAERDAALADAAGLRAATSPAVATWAPVIDAMQCESYSLLSTLRVLTDATEHLLRDHDCDAHGWEVYGAAAKAGRATLDTLAAAGAASSGMVPAWPTTDALAAGATGRGDGGDDETKGATT